MAAFVSRIKRLVRLCCRQRSRTNAIPFPLISAFGAGFPRIIKARPWPFLGEEKIEKWLFDSQLALLEIGYQNLALQQEKFCTVVGRIGVVAGKKRPNLLLNALSQSHHVADESWSSRRSSVVGLNLVRPYLKGQGMPSSGTGTKVVIGELFKLPAFRDCSWYGAIQFDLEPPRRVYLGVVLARLGR